MNMKLNFVTTILIVLILSGCASVSSIKKPGSDMDGGLVYYLPKKDIIIKATVKTVNNSVKKISLESMTSDAYPDYSEQYVLKYQYNLFGDNSIDLGINEKGLLTTAKAKTVSRVNDALENLAKSAGSIAAVAGLVPSACSEDGVYTFIYDNAVQGGSVCGLSLEITRIDAKSYNNIVEINPTNNGSLSNDGESLYGIFYRQLMPYKIIIKDQYSAKTHHENIVHIPSYSKTHFLPISKTFFSDNEIEFGFTDGMPTKYVQKTNSELVGLFKLPGSLIGGFFDGVTSGLEKLVGVKAKETDLAGKSSLLELARFKHEKCIAALDAQNEDLINQYCK